MERLVNIYSDLSTQIVSKIPLGRQQKISIAAAVSLVVLYLARKAVTPPARLRHLPYVGLFTFLNAFMRRRLMSDLSSEVTLPAAMKSSSGLYTVRDHRRVDEGYSRADVAYCSVLTKMGGASISPVQNLRKGFCSKQVCMENG